MGKTFYLLSHRTVPAVIFPTAGRLVTRPVLMLFMNVLKQKMFNTALDLNSLSDSSRQCHTRFDWGGIWEGGIFCWYRYWWSSCLLLIFLLMKWISTADIGIDKCYLLLILVLINVIYCWYWYWWSSNPLQISVGIYYWYCIWYWLAGYPSFTRVVLCN